jgi:hypothetical protein
MELLARIALARGPEGRAEPRRRPAAAAALADRVGLRPLHARLRRTLDDIRC